MPVGAQVFVAEATGDLEVAVEAGDHQQLLVKLRRLRQGVELTRMHPARHDVIARAFGGGFGEDGGFDLQESTVVEKATSGLLQPMPQDKIFLQLGPAQVEIAMLETELFCRKLLSFAARDRDCRRDRWPNDLKIASLYLDVAGLHFRIPHLRRARGDFAVDGDDGFESELAGALDYVRRRPLGVEGHLYKPPPIAQIEEDYTAQVAGSMYPPAEFDFDASVGRSELAAQMRALCGGEAGCGGRGGQRRVVWVE